jgi:uncharacterized protein (TIRG00374 family)
MKFKHYWRVWVGLVISGVLLWLAFQGVDWPSLGRALMAISWTSCGVAALFFLTNLIVRAVRWRVLLAPVHKVPLLEVFAYSQIGYLSNILLPLRAGEFVRAILVGQRYGISTSAVLATVAVERALDILNLLAFALVLPLIMEMPKTVRQSVLLTGILATLAVITLWGMSWQERRVERFVGQASSFIPRPLRRRLTNPIITFTRGLRVLRSGGGMLSSIVCSLAAWVLVLLEILFIFEGFGLALPWYAGVFLIVVLNLGMAVPSSPGFIGVAHYLIVLALSVFAVDQAKALSVALITHGLNFVLNIVLGLAFLWRENIAFSRLGRVSVSV